MEAKMTLRDEYDSVFHSLSRAELQTGDAGLDDLVLPDLFGGVPDGKWLGYYTHEGLRLGLAKYGLWDAFAELGYREVRLETRCEDPDEHLLRIWSEDPLIDEAPLLELVARRDVLRFTGELLERVDREHYGVLGIEWLALQRPDGEFTESRPPLPGQQYPGLGLGREILELLRQAAKRLGLEALVTVPSYFHNAYFYDVEFQYVDPVEQGIFRGLCRDVVPGAFESVAAASWAITLGMVVEEENDDEPFQWFHDAMLAPISDRLTRYMKAGQYQEDMRASLAAHDFRVLERVLDRQLETRGIRPLDRERIAEWIGERV